MHRNFEHQVARLFHSEQGPANGEMPAATDRQELRKSLNQTKNQRL